MGMTNNEQVSRFVWIEGKGWVRVDAATYDAARAAGESTRQYPPPAITQDADDRWVF